MGLRRTSIQTHLALAFGMLMLSCAAFAQSEDEEELASIYGDKANVSIATGNKQPLIRAPAVASVITAQDIAAMGATTLAQALQSVPGLHVARHPIGAGSIFSIRGDHTFLNPRTLVLVNGIPANQKYSRSLGVPEQIINVENIARIEVVRGSGSALYGADAFSGVISITTKGSDDIKGTEVGARVGNFNSRIGWILHGGKIGPVDAAFYVRTGHSDGQNSTVDADFQSALDKVFQSNASHAPGKYNGQFKSTDAQAEFSYENWRLRFNWQEGEHGTGLGLSDALDPGVVLPTQRWGTNLTYQKPQFAKDWDLSGVFSWQDMRQKLPKRPYILLPAGTLGGAFPDGVQGAPARSERIIDMMTTVSYTGWDKHKLRMGFGAKIEDMYETSELKNFNVVSIPGIGPAIIPLGRLVDATGDPNLIYALPQKRRAMYVLIQDEWSINGNLSLTIGVRRDRYSDFGSTTNPRLALVWDARYNLVIKAIHNRAFRAASTVDQFTINNPVSIGNPNIKPERIGSSELVFSWNATDKLQTNLNLFYYKMTDIIRKVPNSDPITGSTLQNTGSQKGKGFEFEATWSPQRNLRFTGSYSAQKSIDEATGQDAGLAPHKRLYVRGDWQFAPLWAMTATVNHVADRRREVGDNRPPVADYTLFDFSLRRERAFGNWDLKLAVQNIFNRDAREPTFAPGNVPNDMPMPGRAVYLQANYRM